MPESAKADGVSLSDFDKLQAQCRLRLKEYIVSTNMVDSYLYLDRLEYELKVFGNSGYSSVILIIADYIRWARENKIVVGPGRGSAAGSLVVFLTGITTIDPIKFGLIFERFLNPERVSLPDIDTDFSDRDAVIDYLREKYGQNRVAKVGVPSLYKPRSSIDEFSNVYHVEFGDDKRITKLIGDAKTFEEAFKDAPKLADYEKKYPDLFRMARNIQGVVRQVTTHPSAVILTRGPIGSEIPMVRPPGESGKEGQLATGWDGEELDSLGYVKLDILTVDNLSIINRAIGFLGASETGGKKIDFYQIPLDDAHTLRGFELGETVAVFQLEEPKTVGILTRLTDMKFEDIAAVNALIRPGLDVSQFINARNTGHAEYLIPELEPILCNTHGVILYQEQVMRMCVELAGFSMAKADKVRKIIAKTANQRAVDGLKPVYEDFKKGYEVKGLDMGMFEKIWEKILACQNYIFNLAHATCYGYIAYADMFLKRHHPLQFMCSALMTKSKELYIKECDRLGIKVLPPCVNKSEENYSIEGDSIRMGLSCIKHIGTKASVLIDRRPYTDEFHVVSKAKLNAKQIEALVYSGAFDCFGDRSDIAKLLCKQGVHEQVTIGELAMKEKEMLEFYLLFNPLADFYDDLNSCVTPEMTKQPANAKVGGMVSRLKEHQAKTGMMAFVTLLTEDGEMEVIVWPSDWPSQKSLMKIGNVVIGNGKRTEKGNYSLSHVRVLREQNDN